VSQLKLIGNSREEACEAVEHVHDGEHLFVAGSAFVARFAVDEVQQERAARTQQGNQRHHRKGAQAGLLKQGTLMSITTLFTY